MRRQWKTVTEVQKLCDFSLDEIERGLERKKKKKLQNLESEYLGPSLWFDHLLVALHVTGQPTSSLWAFL